MMILLSNPLSAIAQDPQAVGRSKAEVLKLLGPPEEKIEKESKRISFWHYPAGRVLKFREGRVVQDGTRVDAATKAKKLKTAQKISRPTSPERNPVVKSQPPRKPKQGRALSFTGQDVFDEISKLESSDDASESDTKPRFPSRRGKR